MSARPQMSQEELEQARAVRARVHELMPSALPFIDSLVREGLIRGWRDVKWVGTLEEGEERHRRLFAERSLNYAQFKNLDELLKIQKGPR